MNTRVLPSTTTTGSLVILDKDNAKYTVPGPLAGSGTTLEYKLSLPDQPCPDNIARKIQFGEFSSATRITLCDVPHTDPHLSHGFRLEFLTTRKITATQAMELEAIFTYQSGQIVEPGLLLTLIYRRDQAQIRDALSYIAITAPTSPP